MFERFTNRARRVVVLAQEEARALNHNYIGTEHILLGLIAEEEGIAARVLHSLGVDLDRARAHVLEIIGHGGTVPSGHIPFTPGAKRVLELSLREALQLGHNHIGTEHILLGLIREGEGVAAQVLATFGVELGRVRQAVIADPQHPPGSQPRGATTAMAGGWGGPPPRPVPRCSFCGRDEDHCEHVLIARGVRLCDECARDAAAQLAALPADAPKLVRYRRREYAPSDKDAAVSAIERAFDAVTGPMRLEIDQALAFAEGGEECREFLEVIHAVKDRVPVVVNDQTVERVRFLSEIETEVSVGIWFAGNPQPMLQPGHAVFEDGTWKVSRSSLQHYAQQARPFLPPRGL